MSKNGKSHYGYKLHTIMDTDYDLIRRIDTTTANVHDSHVDLSEEGEVVYRDRGYQRLETVLRYSPIQREIIFFT
jgi:IS5 family transposase